MTDAEIVQAEIDDARWDASRSWMLPMDAEKITARAAALESVLRDAERWRQWARENGHDELLARYHADAARAAQGE